MKQFISKTILAVLMVGLILTSVEIYKLHDGSYVVKVLGNEVYRSITKSKKHKKVKVLVIGDSVANQLYSNTSYNDSIYSLACNQAISLAGNYFLIHNFFEANEDQLPEKVVLILCPGSFSYDLDLFAFQYFLKPFYTDEYKPLMNHYLTERIEDIPFYYTTQWPFVKTTSLAPEYEPESPFDAEWLSPISVSYLNKIDSLCATHHVKLELLAAPSRASKQPEIEQLVKNQKTSLNNDSLLINYVSTLRYLDDRLFCDPVHFIRKYIPTDYYQLVEK